MKKTVRYISLIISCIMLLSQDICALESSTEKLSTSAQCAVLTDAHSGEILYEKNAHTRRGMASTTKIMTAIVALESLDTEETVLITDQSVGIEGSSIYLCKDEKLTLKELLYALLLESANDAACAIAIATGGSIDGFVKLMNEKAEALGLKNTHFTNPHGLYDDSHYSTAYDLAVLLAYCMENEDFAELTKTKKVALKGADSTYSRLLTNHNKLLNDKYIIGGKTGFTKKTGRCLVSCSERDGTRLIAVTLNAPSDWQDHRAMYEYGYKLYKNITLEEAGVLDDTIHVCGGTLDEIQVEITSGISITTRNDVKYDKVLKLKRFYYPPIEQGQVVGYLCYYNSSRLIAEVPIISCEKSDKIEVEKGFFEKLFD